MTFTEMQAHIQIENKIRRVEDAVKRQDKFNYASRTITHQNQNAKIMNEFALPLTLSPEMLVASRGSKCRTTAVPAEAVPIPRLWLDADVPFGISCNSDLPKVHIIPSVSMNWTSCTCILPCPCPLRFTPQCLMRWWVASRLYSAC